MASPSAWELFKKRLESLGMQTGYFQTFPEKDFADVLEEAKRVSRRDKRTAEHIAYCRSTLLHKGWLTQHRQVARIIEAVAKKDPSEGFVVANSMANEFEEIAKIGSQYVPVVLDAVERIIPYSIETATRLLKGQYTRLEKVVAAGDEHVKPYFEQTVHLSKTDPAAGYAFWEDAPNLLSKDDTSNYQRLVDVLSRPLGKGDLLEAGIIRASADTHQAHGPPYAKALLESIATLQEQDPQQIPHFLQAYLSLAKDYMPKNIPSSHPNLFLIEYVHDPQSANLVKPLVDMDDPGVKQAYAQKVRRFY